ncbi:unnamed protein product [Symbiodinium sp. CCMP2456]|nr:unnamed protein product [Symbiodinium sp. CCMP2456]
MYVPSTGPIMSSPYMTQEPGAIPSFAQPVMSQPYFLQEPTSKTAVPAAFQDPGVPVPLPALAAAPQGAPAVNGIRTARPSNFATPAVIDDGTAAVFLQQYFSLVKSHCETRLVNKKSAMRELNGKLFPLIVEAFHRHDRDGDGVLNKQEAHILFTLFVSDRLGFSDAARAMIYQQTGDSEKAADRVAQYSKFKEMYDKRAFQAFVSDEDGYMQLHEVLSTLSLHTDKHMALFKAFGLQEADEETEESYYVDHYA